MLLGPLFLAVVPLLCILALVPPRPAAAAGVLTGVGASFVYLWYSGRQRCLDMGASCEFGDNTPTLLIAWVLLLAGLALTALSVRDARVPSARG